MCEICSKLTLKTQNDSNDVVLVPLLLTLNIFHTFLWHFQCCFWTIKYRLGRFISNTAICRTKIIQFWTCFSLVLYFLFSLCNNCIKKVKGEVFLFQGVVQSTIIATISWEIWNRKKSRRKYVTHWIRLTLHIYITGK